MIEGSSKTMSVTYPWPPAILSPNARGTSWRHRAVVTKSTRKRAAEITHNAGLNPVNTAMPAKIIFHPRSKAQDRDNAVAWFKASSDGIADAMAVNDVTFKPEYIMAAPVKNGAVVVIFKIPE